MTDQAVTLRDATVVIPARGGSKGVPLKNLEQVGGVSLVGRAVVAATGAPSVDLVLVSTDHEGIAAEAERFGARVVVRPDEIAGDTATSESAVLHALDEIARDGIEPFATVLVQATSPFIDSGALDRAVRRVLEDQDDSVLAAAPSHTFSWRVENSRAVAVGHDASVRLRRQDLEPLYRETGAFYAMRTDGLREHGHRFFGRIGLEEVPEDTAMEIDTPEDLAVARVLARSQRQVAVVDVDALVTDFDGVHTDDKAVVSSDGTEMVAVSRADGMGVARLRRAGVPVLILSTETNPVVAARAEKLGVECLHGVEDKAGALRKWMEARRLDPARVAYLGNDINDLGALAIVGWPAAVGDARQEVLDVARIVLEHGGGTGAVRELSDLILGAKS